MSSSLGFLTSPVAILSIVISVVAIVILIVLQQVSRNYSRREKGQGERAAAFRLTVDLIRIVVLLLAFIIVLKINGINVVSLIAGLGIASAVIGLAMQDFIKDVITGLYIVLYHFYSVGECVEYQGREGVILSFNLKTTKIGDLEDHSVRTICNRNITEIRRIAKRLDIDLPLSYDEDPRTVRTVLHTVCRQIEENVTGVTKCDYMGTQSFESSAILYKIRLFCEPKDRPDIRRAALAIIQDTFGAAGIQIPFNQLDVHLDAHASGMSQFNTQK